MIDNRILFNLFFGLVSLLFHLEWLSAQTTLPFSHAHNDYEKLRKPFFDAYQMGFKSIEVDVFPHKGKLVVSHVSITIPVSKSLEELYLIPIRDHLKVETVSRPSTVLMVDVKRAPALAFARLEELIKRYPTVFRKWTMAEDSTGGIRLLLSGAVPVDQILKDSSGYFAMDGRPTLVKDTRFNVEKMPRISLPYHSISHWNGMGTMPPKQESKFERLIKEAHTSGRKIRLWGMPNSKRVWDKMIQMGVDWINVDKIVVYKNYISQQPISKPIKKPF